MKIVRIAAAAAMVAGMMVTASPSAQSRDKELEQGCYERDWGYRCFYGPIDVNFNSEQDVKLVPAIPEAGYIASLYATLVDPYNVETDHHAAHLHHIVFGNPNREDLTCGDQPYFNQIDRFFAVGKERTPMQLPEGYGYRWDGQPWDAYPQAGPAWVLIHHIHSMIKKYKTQVFVRFDVGFVPEAEAAGMTDIVPVWLDVDNCSDSEFDVPKDGGVDGVYAEPWEYTMPMSGEFISFGGHLHDGGMKLRLDNVTTGAKVWVARPRYTKDSNFEIRKIPGYSAYPGKHVTAGDQLRLTAYYDDSSAWDDVMGIMVGAFVPDP